MVLPLLAIVPEAVGEAAAVAAEVYAAYEMGREVYNEATDTWHDISDAGRNIADEFGNDEEFINNTQVPMSSNKSQRTNSYLGAPGSAPRSTRVPTVTTYAHKPGSKASQGGFSNFPRTKVSLKRSTPASGKLDSSLATDQKYFDSHLVMSTGENRLSALNVKLGKQLYPDVIGPFLAALNGHGKIKMQFAGRCISNIGKRHTSIQLFRHNLSETTTTNVNWPEANLPYILSPGNPEVFYPAGGTISNSMPVGSTSMRDIKNGSTYWAPYNISDLEDCSWNLNKLKLGELVWNQASAVPTQLFQVPVFQAEKHARASAIFLNNDRTSSLPGTASATTAPYRYNAVLNKGQIHYDFMNKGTGGAKVEIIIYRVKKGGQLNALPSSQFSNNTFCNTAIHQPIGQGYVDTKLAQAGTDALNGRKPKATDVYQDAAFPLLPQLAKTKQIDLPFVEVVRQTFAMTSGARREVTFDLPGEVYDPNNQPGNQVTATPVVPPILGNHTYLVYLSCSGVICTDQVTPSTQTASAYFNVGDTISAANIQFYATYTEHIGACQYKKSPLPNLYSQGALIAPGTNPIGFGKDVPITMVDQASAVRLPNLDGTNSTGGSNLRNDFEAIAS